METVKVGWMDSCNRGTSKFPPWTYRGGRFGQIQIFWIRPKTVVRSPDFENINVLAFLGVTYLQISY